MNLHRMVVRDAYCQDHEHTVDVISIAIDCATSGAITKNVLFSIVGEAGLKMVYVHETPKNVGVQLFEKINE